MIMKILVLHGYGQTLDKIKKTMIDLENYLKEPYKSGNKEKSVYKQFISELLNR